MVTAKWVRVWADVIAHPPGELFSETNDNSVAILLSYGTARVLLIGDAEARGEYMATGPLHEASSGHQRSETTHTLSCGSVHC
jgi:competence protein ComEC